MGSSPPALVYSATGSWKSAIRSRHPLLPAERCCSWRWVRSKASGPRTMAVLIAPTRVPLQLYCSVDGCYTRGILCAMVGVHNRSRLTATQHFLDPYLLVIGLAQTCFEGSMYLFVFLWVPSLQEASPSAAELPLGYIFSCFMVAMMLGSLAYTSLMPCILYCYGKMVRESGLVLSQLDGAKAPSPHGFGLFLVV